MTEQELIEMDKAFSQLENINFDIDHLNTIKKPLEKKLEDAKKSGYLSPVERIEEERKNNAERKKDILAQAEAKEASKKKGKEK